MEDFRHVTSSNGLSFPTVSQHEWRSSRRRLRQAFFILLFVLFWLGYLKFLLSNSLILTSAWFSLILMSSIASFKPGAHSWPSLYSHRWDPWPPISLSYAPSGEQKFLLTLVSRNLDFYKGSGVCGNLPKSVFSRCFQATAKRDWSQFIGSCGFHSPH